MPLVFASAAEIGAHVASWSAAGIGVHVVFCSAAGIGVPLVSGSAAKIGAHVAFCSAAGIRSLVVSCSAAGIRAADIRALVVSCSGGFSSIRVSFCSVLLSVFSLTLGYCFMWLSCLMISILGLFLMSRTSFWKPSFKVSSGSNFPHSLSSGASVSALSVMVAFVVMPPLFSACFLRTSPKYVLSSSRSCSKSVPSNALHSFALFSPCTWCPKDVNITSSSCQLVLDFLPLSRTAIVKTTPFSSPFMSEIKQIFFFKVHKQKFHNEVRSVIL